jgi:hypothetical protein
LIEIPLTQGQVALIDDEDYPYLAKYSWKTHKDHNIYYARGIINGKRVLMHRIITQAQRGIHIDHINGNGLDNRKNNLRVASGAENQRNQHTTRGKSKYKGVCWNKNSSKWQAKISFNNKDIHIGYFKEEEDAANAYDKRAIELFGEFACPNFGGIY